MSKVFLGMSGGVDSSASALLLQEQGYDVTGIYMKNWSEDLPGMKCPWAEDLADAKRVAVQLDLDFEVWDFEQEYKKQVVDYMLSEFQNGRTPNPDVICNELIKFKLFYERATQSGADFIATGHYAKVGLNSAVDSTNKCLLRARDANKDQTYFLYRMSDAATTHTLFPVGGMLKSEVKALAASRGLDVAGKKESMGICFVGEVGMKDFLKEYLSTQPGEIREIETEKILGYHDGAVFYTIGQRHGLYLGGGLPFYVVKKDLTANVVYVSKDLNHSALWAEELTIEDCHWRNGLTIDQAAKLPDLTVRLRHRAPLIPVTIRQVSDSSLVKAGLGGMVGRTARNNIKSTPRDNVQGENHIRADAKIANKVTAQLRFLSAVKRPASGQSAVLYSGEVCIGGGIIGS